VTISERAAGRGFVPGSEGLGFLAILTADVGSEVLWRLRHGTNALVRGSDGTGAGSGQRILVSSRCGSPGCTAATR
jgi:hypothetical protein